MSAALITKDTSMSEVIEHEPQTSLTLAIRTTVPTIIAADKNDILGAYAKKVSAFRPDISTQKGRDAIRSIAAEGRSVKASLLKFGDAAKEDAIKIQRAIVAEKKILEERMDEVIAKVRAPLTEYEEAEKRRVKAHEDALASITEHAGYGQHETAAELLQRLIYLRNYPDREWQEFAAVARAALQAEIIRTEALHAAAEKREAEAAELAQLRAEREAAQRREAARLEAERQAQITAAAVKAAEERAAREAETARLKAEQEAAAVIARAEEQRLAAQRQAAEAAERERQAEQRAREAEEAGRRAAENARVREEQAKAAAAVRQAEMEAEAERLRVAAEEKAKRDAAAAVEAERRRLADEAEQRRLAEAKRAANVAHMRKINGEALNALLSVIAAVHSADVEEGKAIGKAIVTAIAKREIPHVRMEY